MSRPAPSKASAPPVRTRHVPQWTYVSIPIGFMAWVIVMGLVVHPWTAQTLFTTWSLSGAQIYTLALTSTALALLAWFDLACQSLTRSKPVPLARVRLGVAVALTVPVTLQVGLLARTLGKLSQTELLIRDMGYELGKTEAAVTGTVFTAVIPTLALCAALVWWVKRHPGAGPLAYMVLVVWLVAVAAAGWAVGHP